MCGDWKEIETAPKDGTFLAWFPDDGGRVDFCHWQDFGPTSSAPVGWRDSFINVYPEGDEIAPTHWMPLPAAPGTASRPTPDTQTAAIGAEAMREALVPFSIDAGFYPASHDNEKRILIRCKLGDTRRAASVLAALSQPVAAPQAEAPQPEGGTDRLVTALTKVMPIRVQNGPDYAEVYFSDGSTHSTQAMTMNPDDWTAINEAFAALQPEKTNGQ